MGIQIKEYAPRESLKPFVELFWEGSFNINATTPMSMQMIPNGCLELIIHLNDLHCDLESNNRWSQTPDHMIIGLITQPRKVRFQNFVRVFAIRFKPEGIYNIFGIPSSLLLEHYHDMSMVLGSSFLEFCHRLKENINVVSMIQRTENYLLKNLHDRKIELNYVNRAAHLIRNTKGIKIKDLSNKLLISQRKLQREFKDILGISPKHYLRLVRINEVLRLINDNHMINLTHIAHHCGYFDQAHFIKDFKNITGQKPSIFMKDSEQFISRPGLTHYGD